jgi:hypothetical protein
MDVNTLDNRGKVGILKNENMNFWLNYPEEFEGEIDAAPSALQVCLFVLFNC